MTKPIVMGILNVTPDSFSDGGNFENIENIKAQVEKLIEEGATIIDIGGESTRPGAQLVDVDTELKRVLPIIDYIKANYQVEISLDTYKPKVAKAGIEAGIDYINDVRGTQFNTEMLDVVIENNIKYICMHNDPSFRDANVKSKDAVEKIIESYQPIEKYLFNNGYDLTNLIIDPGIGFYKTHEQSLSIIANLKSLVDQSQHQVLLGTSRKSSLGYATGIEVASERDVPTAVTSLYAMRAKCEYVRVHNPKVNIEAMQMMEVLDELR